MTGAALFAAFVALVVGVASANALSRSIGEPLRALVTMLERVGRGDLTGRVTVDDVGEIGMLQRGVNEMVDGLRERERIQDLFGRHVGPAVAEEAIHGGVTLGGGEQREVVALFVDITGSTRLTRNTEPAEFVAMLNRFFAVVVDAVEENGGLVNKFEGDAALCVFGAPVLLDDPARPRCAPRERSATRSRRPARCGCGIGVAAGPVIAGQIGAATPAGVHGDRRRGERGGPPDRTGQAGRRRDPRQRGHRRVEQRRTSRSTGSRAGCSGCAVATPRRTPTGARWAPGSSETSRTSCDMRSGVTRPTRSAGTVGRMAETIADTGDAYVTNGAWLSSATRADTIDEVADQFERPSGAQSFWSEVSQRRAERIARLTPRSIERRAG